MFRSTSPRRPVGPALALLACAAPALAQDRVVFSVTTAVSAPFGTLNNTELAQYDPATGRVTPWLRDATATYYVGDLNGDGLGEVWRNVDALSVTMAAPDRVGAVHLSFSASFGSLLDGDVVLLGADGTLAVAWSEAQLVAAFGCTDGNVDVDALKVLPDGTLMVSFADNEASSILSTDQANVITDGSVVSWNPATGSVSVILTEGNVDALVSHALGKATATGDTKSITVDSTGELVFTVQSPSSDDATLFSAANNGSVYLAESALGLPSTAEIDAFDFVPATCDFLVSHASSTAIPSTAALSVDFDGAPNRSFVLLLGLARGDSDAFPVPGFKGLALPVNDPLFLLSLGAVPFLFGTTDASGHGAVDFPNAPAGLVLTVFGQPFDLSEGVLGTPIEVDFTG
jgi:hypothetical protein